METGDEARKCWKSRIVMNRSHKQYIGLIGVTMYRSYKYSKASDLLIPIQF